MDDNKRRLYDALSSEYDMGTFEQFASDIKDDAKRKRLYDAVSTEYDLGDYDSFSKQLFQGEAQQIQAPTSERTPNYTATTGDYTQPTEAQRNFEERGNFEPIGQGSVELNGQDVPVLVGAQGQFRVPSPVKLDEQQEIFRHGNPSEAEVREYTNRAKSKQAISNFGEGVAQGADALYQGGKNAVAEYSNIITGSQRDAQLGLDILSARSEGVIPEFDVNSELDAYNKSEYEKRLKDIEDRRAAATSTTAGRWKQFAMDLIFGREEDNLRKENLSVADYLHRKRAFEAIKQALKDSAGDVEKAKKLLAERAKIESWGDAKGREAREAMSQHRPTEGAAWVGEMIPQMAGTAAGLAASLHPATRPLAGVLGKSNLLGLTISSMGSQMAEARNDGASEGDVFKAGALNAAVEAGSEYVPFSRYFGRLVKNTGDVIGRVVGESLERSPRAKKELQDLLKKGSKELGKLFTGKNAMEFAKDITGEAASEFVAEFGNALIPLIYSNPELYPTLLQAVENGWEGAKGGLFMGTFLGSGSKLASYYAHDKRRKQQGFVVLAETSDGDVVEYAGKDENGNAVVIDGNGEQLTIDSDELGEAVRVSYNEFKTGERGAFRDRMEESFNDGKSAQTKEDKEYIGLSYEYALRRLEELSGLSAEGIKNGFPNAVAVYEAADDAVKANNIEYAKALNDYANAWARLEGSNNAIEEVVEQQSAASDAEVDALSDNGVMRPATLRSGEKVFVIGGNIAVDNNGGIVYEESDAQIVVNVNGERKVVGIAEIGAVGETVNSEEEKISRRGRIESDINNKHNSDINGWKELVPGESYNVLFDGTPFELMVVGRNENGELLISGDGGKSTEPISEADFQNSIREYELRQITVAELNERFAGKLKVLNAMLANIRSEGNEDKAAANFSEVENMVAELDGELPDGYRVVAENGNYVIADALVSANENEARAEGNEGEKGSEGNGQQPNVVQESVLSPAEQRKQKRAEVAKRIPMEGKKRLWTMAKPEDVAEYISLLESDPAKQAAIVDGYLAEIAEKQAKLSPIEAAELNEDVEFWNGVKGLLGVETENVARENNVVSKTDGVEAEVDEPTESVSAPAVEVQPANEMQPAEEQSGEANEMVGTVPSEAENRRKATKEAEEKSENGIRGKQKKPAKRAERKKRYAAEDAKLGDYLDFMDFVMREIATGGVKFIWGNSKNSKTKGLGAHLGLTQSNKERMRRIWMLDNEGSYPELAASRLLNEYSAMFGMGMPEEVIGMTDMDAFDILLDVLTTYDSPKAMFEAAQERHNMAEDPYYDITEEEAEAMSMNMSLDKWMAYQEYVMEQAEFLYNNISDEELYAIFAEIYLIEDNERSRENNAIQQGISERQGYEAGNAEGNPVLQGEQLDNTRADRESATTGQERNDIPVEQSAVDVPETSIFGNAEVGSASQNVEETSNGSTISQESEQVGEQDAGPVNMETLQLNMSEEDFNALLNSGDEAAISEYLAELDDALRMDENSPFAGEMALRDEYKNAVQQYGKENIPAEVMDDLTRRMMPYADLSRAIYNRKYALEDKLRELESAAEKATAAKEKEIKVENKNTAFGGFLADKTDLGASTAEKALNKKYNFDGKVMTVAEFVENAVANGNAKLSTIEEPKYKGASRAAWNRMDAKQQEEDAKKVKESGTKTVYTVNDHDLGKTAYDYAKFLLDNKEQIRENVERIEDVGEKIGGAKKDKLRETIDRMKADMEQSDETLIDKIAKLPISKIFNFDFQKLREGGMPNEAISFMEIVKESIPAKPRTSHKVRRWVNNTLALYKLCLEVGTNWDRVNTILTSRDFAGTDLKAQFDAYMSVGGFDSGLNIGNAKLKQLDKTAGYYKDGKFISSEGKWYVRDAGKHGGIYDTKEEAVEALKAFAGDNAGTTESGKKKEVKFAVYQRREDKSIFIAIKGKSDIVIQDGFKSAKEAFDYIEANNAELQSRYRNLLDKTNADFEENRERKGRDYRNGKDITAEEFRTTFGFRGVEFGNWMTQEDRRKAINECYDALMDLAAVCKVSPKALSLNGTLGMAFGSRGGGKFSAHYEPGRVVINLTKTRGAGTLAHEWFHAMDNYFAKMGETEFGYATGGEGMLPKGIQKYGKRYYDRNSGRVITEEEYNELAKEHTVRREMVDAWEHLMESLKESDYYKRSNAYARLHNSKYWNDPTELGARAFSVWVENELSKQDTSNDYLANNPRYAKAEVTDAQDKYMPYPFDTDADWMDEAFGNLFEVMQERETEDGNVALYQRGSLSLDTDNPAFEAATKNTVEAVKKAGVEVEEATPEMVEAVLGAEMMSVNDRLSQLEKVSKIVANWLKNNVRGRSIKVELPLATQRKIRAKMGRNFGSHVITANNVAHSKKNHGENGIKNTENSIPLRDEDFALMPYIMVSPSYVERGSFDSIGSESVRFYKILSNGYVVVVEKEQKNSPNDMETITMWAELSANVPNARNMRPSKSTSETVTISPDDAAKIRKDAENAIRADVKVEKSTAAAPFYSNAKKAVLDIKQEKATPQQWVAMLKKNGGLKAGEDAWVGLEAWLNEQNGSVTKQQIIDFIDENSIRIEEVAYSQFGYGMIDEAANNLETETKAIGWDAMKEKYPGIEEYFEYDNGEILWSEARASVGEYEDFILDNKIVDVNPDDNAINETREKYTTEGLKRKREIALVVPTIESWNESDEIHFGDAGGGRAVVWVRFGETTDSEGKRVLVIDEIQSKRHQEGREKGYGGATSEDVKSALEAVNAAQSEFDEYNAEMAKKYGSEYDWNIDATDAEIDKWQELYDKVARLGQVFEDVAESNRKGIPSAPFEKNWHELAMKRMLRYAAENGFDKVAWTTGDQQADRYDMSRGIDLIQSEDNNTEVFSDGTPVAKDVRVMTGRNTINFKVGEDGIIHGGEFAGKNVAEVFGKELGERIMAPGTNTIEEDGLKIGGEGMKGFYDRMLPSFVQKYTKKWGAKVGEVTMPTLGQNNTMWSVDVTPQMAEEVMKGQPMFLRTEDGTVYGWAVNGKIFLTPEGMNPNTPAHEYTHLWASMIEKNDPKLWSRIVEVMKESPTWNEVLLDEAYRDIHNNDSRMASEVLSRLSGEENYRRAMELAEREIKAADGIIEKAKKIALWGRIKQALADFWASVKGVFGFKDKAPWTEFVDMALGDLYAGVNPNAVGSPLERMFIGERGASNLDRAEEASLRLDNLNVAREMEEAGKGAKAIKLATGWERGADGKWRYEVMDDFAFDMSGNVDYGKRKPESLKEYNRYKELLHKKNALAFEGEELPADELAEFKGLEVVWRGTKLHNSERLKDFIDAPELFEAYPELRNVAVRFDDLGDNVFGQYSAARNEITINSNHKEVAIKSALAHEIQHAIQHIEGFAKGGNTESVRTKAQELRRDVAPLYEMMLDTPEWAEKQRLQKRWFDETDDAKIAEIEARVEEIDNSGVLKGIEALQAELQKKYGLDRTVGRIISSPYAEDAEIWNELPDSFNDRFEAYRSLAGEVEARNVQGRMGMTEEERRNSLAVETEDVAREDQVFIEENLGVSASEGKEILPESETGKENSVSLSDNLNSDKHDNTREKASIPNGARAYIEEVARILQTRLGRAEKPTEEVERIIQNFNRGKTIFAHTPLQRQTLALLRTLTNKEIKEEVLPALETLSNKAKDNEQKREYGELLQVVKRFINRNERSAVIEELSGVKLGEEVSLKKIDELFEMYNSDTNVAELYTRVRRFVDELGLTFEFEELDNDEEGGAYFPSDSRIALNAHLLYAPYASQQKKASTIVHEIIHAVTLSAITAKKNNVKLSPKLEKAAQVIDDVFENIVKNNPTLVHEEYNPDTDQMEFEPDYGASSVLEMVAELANPEFTNKLKKLEYDNRSVWQRIWDAIKSIFIGKDEPQSVYKQLSEAFDAIVENFDREAYERSKEDGYKLYDILGGIRSREDDENKNEQYADGSEFIVRETDLSDGPVREPGEPEWKFKARREKWRRWVNSFVSTKDPVPEKPFQGADETDEEYRERLKAFNKGLKEWKKQVTKTDAGIDEMMEALYNGKSPEQTTEEEFTENVFRRYMGRDGGIEISKKGMRGIIRDEIIERRRLIETNNFEDVLFVNKVKDATTPEERKIIPFIIEGTYNGEVSPELAAVVKSVKDWFETVYQMLQAADAMHSSGKIKNYVTHIWDKERTPKKVYENYINTRSKYTNKRSIETYAEGIALGMVPKYDDVCDIMLEYGHIANEAVANKKFIDFLHELTVDGEPVLIDAKKSNPLYKKTTSEALEGYRVHKYVSGIVNTVLGSVRTPDVPEWASGIAHFYDIAGAFMKKVNLSLSFFHHGALIETAVGAMNPIKAGSTLFKNIIWDSIRTGKAPALANPEAARRAVNHLVQLGATSDYLAKDVQRLTGQLKKFAEELRDKNPNMLTDGAENVATFIDFLNYGFDEVLWTYLHDGLKIYAFDKYAKEIDEYCAKKGLDETDKDMLLNEAGQFVNDTFGGQFWELLDISPAMQKWLRRGLLSPDWTLSTIRQALSPFGFGTLYKDYEDKWYQRLFGGRGDKTDSSAFGRLMNMTEGVKLRRRLGVSFWTMAALTFIPAMNLLNAWRRDDDEEEELKKAIEKRKVDPNYKSPYELKYPNGMKWYDYTMVGNTLGHKTHLFGGRYDDGKEMYIRWGKQFRELPELFLGKDGFVFPGPMIDKLVGKVNPAAHAVLDFAGFSKDGWENVYMKDKIGWEKELGRVMSLVVRCMPYSIPFDEDKEFALTDLMMPSSKGYSRYKALQHFEEAIKSQDMDFVGEVYNACVINKLDAEKLLKAALSRVEAEAKSEYVEGVETLNDAFEAYPVSDVERKRSIRKKMLRLLEENRYKDFERADAEELVLKALRGDGDKASVSLPDVYLRMETPEDVVDDYKIKAIKMALAKVYKEWKGIEDIGARAEYVRKHTKQLRLRGELNEVDRKITEQKRAMSENTKYADAYMNIIRETRREFIERADNLGETVSQME